jgi:GT2 family glycosyltransferase
MTTDTVSAIVPVYNGRRFLAEAVASMLRQSRPPDELVVVDDGSTDGSGDLVRAWPEVRVVRQAHAGQGAALNRGISLTTGAYVTFLDADDRWAPEKLERQLAAFARQPELDLVYGHARQFFDGALGTRALARDARFAEREVLPARLPSAVMIRRAALERVGPFSETQPLGGVIEWFTRATDAGLRVACLPRVVYERRIHAENQGVARARDRAEYARMLKGVLDRRRREGGAA